MAENFDLIFGQNASQQYAWSDTDYQNGWETIGNIPPTAAQFDALQRLNDTKMKELNDELTPLVNADTVDTRQPSTVYREGDIKYSPLLPTGWYLLCTTAGTTSASDLVITSPTVGNTVMDGTVVWTIRKVASTADIPAPVDISSKANVDLSNLTDAGKSFSFPGNTYITLSVTSGQTYTAPADGYVYLQGVRNSSTQASLAVSLTNKTASVGNGTIYGGTINSSLSTFIPCKKGDVVEINYSGTTSKTARFVYANGEVPV